MLRLMLLALLPQIGGILLMIGRARQEVIVPECPTAMHFDDTSDFVLDRDHMASGLKLLLQSCR